MIKFLINVMIHYRYKDALTLQKTAFRNHSQKSVPNEAIALVCCKTVYVYTVVSRLSEHLCATSLLKVFG